MKRFKVDFSLLAELITSGMVGLFTGAFLGAFPFGLGMLGALVGGAIGLVLLVALTFLFHLQKWENAKTILKYASIGILPGLLIGGSKILEFGIMGAQIFGVISAIIYATLVYKLVDYLVKIERYVVFPGHYGLFFILGSISVFITILVVDFVVNLVDFKALIMKIPLGITLIASFAVLAILYLILLGLQKRKSETWNEAFHKSLISLYVIAGIFIVIAGGLTVTQFDIISFNLILKIVAGLGIPYGIGIGLPLAIGILMAHNDNRPVLGCVLSLIGSGFVMFIGIQVAPMLLLPGSGLMWAGLITGLFMFMLSLAVLFKPETHFFAGLSIIIFSILSFLGAAGGLIIGGILGLVGGILIASWAGLDKPVDVDEDKQSPITTNAQSETVSS